MKIVIDIPERVYTYIQREWVECDFDSIINYALNGIKNGKPLEAQSTEVINKIPEDYVYDTETDEFEVYRHKYTGKEIHITKAKEPKLYKMEEQPTDKCKGCYYNDGETHAECVVCDKEAQPNRCDSCKHSEEQDGSNCYECVKGMADKFEAQPTDAVSRTLVHEAITTSIAESENPYEMWQRIEALPSVTPSRKKGKWIVGGRQGGKVICRKCLECGWLIRPNTDNMNYCPRCGAEMSGGDSE